MRHTDSAETPKSNGTHAGIVMHAHRRTFSDEFKGEVRALNKSGKSVTEISNATGVHQTVIRRMLAAKLKKKANPSKITKPHQHPEELRRSAIARVRKGESAKQVAKALGVHKSTVYYWTKTRAATRNVARLEPAPATLKLPDHIKDAISFLRHAKTDAMRCAACGEIMELDRAHLLSMLALSELLKGA